MPAASRPEHLDCSIPEASSRVCLSAVTKHFFDVLANESVDLTLLEGEIHALLGENGAGKSTVCSVLAGLYQPDSGTVTIDGEPVRFTSPADALAAGIGMVYQHFRLVNELTVAENIALGHPATPRIVSNAWLTDVCAHVSDKFGLSLDADALVGSLSVGEQQRVEIARLLHRGVRTLILDEPTAVLTPQEADVLFDNLRALARSGSRVVVVTHKLDEVLAVADSVTVMRAGKVISSSSAKGATAESLSAEMVGRPVAAVTSQPSRAVDTRATALRVEGVTVSGEGEIPAVKDVTFEVDRGEILGVCGVSGNGQRELAEALAGIRRIAAGTVHLDSEDLTVASVATRARRGLAYIPEDRMTTGMAAGLTIEDNLLLRSYRDPEVARGPLINYARADKTAQRLIEEYDVRGVRPGVPASALSGGNIQRAILAREISRRPTVIIASAPTRGLDVGATMAVRQALLDARDESCAVLLISEDLDELLAISDRLVVMFGGELVGSFSTDQVDILALGALMAGVGAGNAKSSP